MPNRIALALFLMACLAAVFQHVGVAVFLLVWAIVVALAPHIPDDPSWE